MAGRKTPCWLRFTVKAAGSNTSDVFGGGGGSFGFGGTVGGISTVPVRAILLMQTLQSEPSYCLLSIKSDRAVTFCLRCTFLGSQDATRSV